MRLHMQIIDTCGTGRLWHARADVYVTDADPRNGTCAARAACVHTTHDGVWLTGDADYRIGPGSPWDALGIMLASLAAARVTDPDEVGEYLQSVLPPHYVVSGSWGAA